MRILTCVYIGVLYVILSNLDDGKHIFMGAGEEFSIIYVQARDTPNGCMNLN